MCAHVGPAVVIGAFLHKYVEALNSDAKNLNERRMSLSGRLAFVEAKRKELESFFVNNVWEFSHENEVLSGRADSSTQA